MKHSFPEDMIRHEREFMEKVEQRSNNHENKTQQTIRLKDDGNGPDDQNPTLPAFRPEGERQLMNQSSNRPDQ